MPLFITVLAICMAAGIAFLIVSLLVLARLPASVNANGEMTINFNGLTIKTSNVCIALALVSALFGLVPPLVLLSQDGKTDDLPIRLSIRLDNVSISDQIHITRPIQMGSSPVILTLFKSGETQSYTLSGEKTGPMQIDARFAKDQKQLLVDITKGSSQFSRVITLDRGMFGELSDSLPMATVVGRAHVPAQHAKMAAVPSHLASLPGPSLPAGSQ
jgi:hypothetical protein